MLISDLHGTSPIAANFSGIAIWRSWTSPDDSSKRCHVIMAQMTISETVDYKRGPKCLQFLLRAAFRHQDGPAYWHFSFSLLR
jgi:hypothetical protein